MLAALGAGAGAASTDTLDTDTALVYGALACVVDSVVGLEGIQCDSGAAPQRMGNEILA